MLLTTITVDVDLPRDGHDPGTYPTGYIGCWTPILGPSATLVLLKLYDATAGGRTSAVIELRDLALDLGLGRGLAKINRTFERLVRFGILRPTVTDENVRILLPAKLPYLTGSQLDRLRPALAQQERSLRAPVTS